MATEIDSTLGLVEVKFRPLPSLVLRRKRYLFYRCCGQFMQRVYKVVMKKDSCGGGHARTERRGNKWARCGCCERVEHLVGIAWM